MSDRRSSVFVASLLAASLLAPSVSAQVHRLGSEFQINTYTDYYQSHPSVAARPDGDFVVVWESIEDGSSTGIFAQRFSSAGTPLAVEFQVNAYTTGYQARAGVAASATGDFVVVWNSSGQDGESYGIFARRFSSAGTALAIEFQVNTYTLGSQRIPVVAADTDWDFVVAWASYGQDGAKDGVFARRFSSAGAALTGEIQVNLHSSENQGDPSVAADGDGDFVVVWNSFEQDGYANGLFARLFSSAGVAFGGELQINAYTFSSQAFPKVAAESDGDFVVAWQSYGQDGDKYGVFARRFSSAGVGLTGELQVDTYVAGDQGYPSVATSAGGDFVVAWQSRGQDGSGFGIFARLFSSAGSASTGEFQVNSYTGDAQAFSALAMQGGGDFVVGWMSLMQDPNQGIFAQRFGGPILLDVDGNGSPEPLTDGLLLLRYLFGFRGTTLITGAVGAGCTRCDAPAIETYLAIHAG